MVQELEKTLEPPQEGWLKEDQKITVHPGYNFSSVPKVSYAKTIKEALKEEVIKYLNSGSIFSKYITYILFGDEKIELKVNIDKEKRI